MIHSCNISREEALTRLEIGNESAQQKEQIRAVASYLRSLILSKPKSQTPQPANIANLKESVSEIPEEIMLFFITLLSGLALPLTENCVEAIRRKAEALASDVAYNVSRGNVRPWKNVLGLGLSAITGSKLVVQILN